MMLALIAEREQFRSLSAAKVQKIIQKTAFGEDINTITHTKVCVLSRKAVYYGWEYKAKFP